MRRTSDLSNCDLDREERPDADEELEEEQRQEDKKENTILTVANGSESRTSSMVSFHLSIRWCVHGINKTQGAEMIRELH